MLLLSSCGQASVASSKGTPQARQTSPTYVAIGASDTFGIGTEDPYNESWPADLAFLMGDKIRLVNLGVPGITTHAALEAELPIALESRPQFVTIWLAVNDLVAQVPVDNYSHDLDLMLTRLQQVAPHAKIAVGNLPDLTKLPSFAHDNPLVLSRKIEVYNNAIAGVVQQHHVILVDLSGQRYNLQDFPQYISGDGLHPSAIGYERLAELFYVAISKN